MDLKFKKYQSVGFWKRCFAFIFDVLIINFLIIWPFRGVLSQYFKNSVNVSAIENISPQFYFTMLMISLLALLYFSFFEYYLRQTPGMMLFDLKVISLNENLGFFRCLVRNIFILPFFPFYVFWFVEPFYLIFFKERFLEKITLTKSVINRPAQIAEYKLNKV